MLSRFMVSGMVLVAAMATRCEAQNLVFQRVSATASSNADAAAQIGTTGPPITNSDSDTTSGSAPQNSSGTSAQAGIGPNDFAQVATGAQALFNPDGQIVSQLVSNAVANMNLRSTDTPAFGAHSAGAGGVSVLEIVDLTGGGGTFDVTATITINYNWKGVPGGIGIQNGDDPNSGFNGGVGIAGETWPLGITGYLMTGTVEVCYPDGTFDNPELIMDGNDHEIEITYTWENVSPAALFQLSGWASAGGTATADSSAASGNPVALTRIITTSMESRIEITQN